MGAEVALLAQYLVRRLWTHSGYLLRPRPSSIFPHHGGWACRLNQSQPRNPGWATQTLSQERGVFWNSHSHQPGKVLKIRDLGTASQKWGHVSREEEKTSTGRNLQREEEAEREAEKWRKTATFVHPFLCLRGSEWWAPGPGVFRPTHFLLLTNLGQIT